jgi:AcrR family transcriptional regulator
MPRRFRKDEEEKIRAALLEAGGRIMGARGVRKTSIDELVREAGISKGSFYRFFPGKEALALEVLARWEREFHVRIRQLFSETAPRGVTRTAEFLHTIFMEEFPRRVAESGLRGLMQPDEIAHLARAADGAHTRLMDEQDLRFFAELKPLFGNAGLHVSARDEVVMAGLRLLFDAALGIIAAHPDSTGKGLSGGHGSGGPGGPLETGHFDRALTFLIRGFLSETCVHEEDHHGD